MGRARLTDQNHISEWPLFLQEAAGSVKLDAEAWQPIVVQMNRKGAMGELEELLAYKFISEVQDNYDEQLAELFLSLNAHLYKANPDVQAASIADHLKKHYGSTSAWQLGSWVYYPWNGQLVHVLAEDLFWELRTIRNKNLITAEEQEKFAGFKVGCLGMSVGSHGAGALVIQGGSKQIKLSDGAVISGSNLNRIRTGVASVGVKKSIVVARQLYEMNPYIEVHRFDASITAKTVSDFFTEPWKLDLVVDEIDDLEIKIRLRVEARRRGIPVIMATDLGDDCMLDIERFDLDPGLPLFHGLAGDIEKVLDKTNLTQRQWLKYATTIIGTKNVPLRMQQSLLQVGTKLPTQPQLGGTAMMAGSVLAYAARKLALGEPIKSGRMAVSLDRDLLQDHGSVKNKWARAQHSKVLDKALKSM